METYLQAIFLGVSLAAPLGPVTVLMLDKILKKDLRSAYAMSFSAIAGDFIKILFTWKNTAGNRDIYI